MTDKVSDSSNKRLTVRATPGQLEILKCAFAHSAATPKDVLKRLSDETGLSTKWIVAWFTRQRRKRTRDSGNTCLDPALSPEEIANFKTEYREPELQISADAIQSALPISRKRHVDPVPKTKRRGRPPKAKVKAEHNDGENALASNQPSSPSSVLLTIRPILPVSDRNVCNSNSMRSIVPRLHLSSGFQSHQMPLSFAAVSNPHSQPDFLNPSVGPDVLDYDYFPGNVRYSLSENQEGPPRSIQSPELHLPTIQDENFPPSRTGYPRRSAARRPPYPSRTVQWPSRMPVASLAQLPLFTHNVLPSRSLPDPDNDTTIMENVTSASKIPHDPPTNLYTSLPDPSKAPFKHLSIFHPTHMDYTEDMSTTFDNTDAMIDRLLDEKLAVDDPFQATMGLVLLSQLGLEWNYE